MGPEITAIGSKTFERGQNNKHIDVTDGVQKA
jgi:hypothetical protein